MRIVVTFSIMHTCICYISILYANNNNNNNDNFIYKLLNPLVD